MSAPTADQRDAMGLVLAAQHGLDPAALVSRDGPEVLAEAARAASVLIAARLRRFAPCRAEQVTWRVTGGALTFDGHPAGRLVPALICAADTATTGGDWQPWDALWGRCETAGQRDLAVSLLSLLTTPTEAS
ncbi:hypothetical protein [Cellulosimicrobium sp. Marseille-Q4280]|uniref:hypothetical protein n=1 Tax=Cellulosimicrobium sp. Marseille-Q4280 TaxID=2937992 RepID=UPI00203B0B5C|nr:hypothetical protein [Cellulosimicrobium sp. Marseille-Q4280]